MGRVYEQARCVRTSLVFDFGGNDILAETLNCLKNQELRKAGFLQNHGNVIPSEEDWQRATEFFQESRSPLTGGVPGFNKKCDLGKITEFTLATRRSSRGN